MAGPGASMTEETPSSGPDSKGAAAAGTAPPDGPATPTSISRALPVAVAPPSARSSRCCSAAMFLRWRSAAAAAVGDSCSGCGRCRPGSSACSSTRTSSASPSRSSSGCGSRSSAHLRQARSDPEPAPGHPPGHRDLRASESSLRPPAGVLRGDPRDRRGRSRETG